jgi:hypothetical protein
MLILLLFFCDEWVKITVLLMADSMSLKIMVFWNSLCFMSQINYVIQQKNVVYSGSQFSFCVFHEKLKCNGHVTLPSKLWLDAWKPEESIAREQLAKTLFRSNG